MASQVKQRVIVIDGGGGTGTSSNGRATGKKLGCDYLNSGEIYRAFALQLMNEGWGGANLKAEPALAGRTVRDYKLVFADGSVSSINGVNCFGILHAPEIGRFVPYVAEIPEVRRVVGDLTRRFTADRHLSIIEGRAGAWEIPDSELKIWLTCDPVIAASRRGCSVEDLIARNDKDATRETSPMIKHPDAIQIDTSTWTVDQVSDHIVALWEMVQARHYALR
jgi:cytidylate kinase